MAQKPLIILGFGGHARSVADVAIGLGYSNLLFIDKNASPDEMFAGHRVLAQMPDHIASGTGVFSAAGDNGRREAVCNTVELPLATLIAASAHVGIASEIGVGTFVGSAGHVGPKAKIGKGVILNTGSIVEHESVIGDFTHVSVNATVAGRSSVGRRVMLGAGSVVIDGVSVCDDVIVGAGAVVVTDITVPGTYVGVPARRLER